MISHGKDVKVFCGNSNPQLAAEICKLMGTKLGESEVGTFSDGEIFVSLYETVRGSDVFVVQSTSTPVNSNLMELLIMIDAFRRASASASFWARRARRLAIDPPGAADAPDGADAESATGRSNPARASLPTGGRTAAPATVFTFPPSFPPSRRAERAYSARADYDIRRRAISALRTIGCSRCA